MEQVIHRRRTNSSLEMAPTMSSSRTLILDRIRKIPDLPRLPDIFAQIEEAARDEKTSAIELAEIIETDPTTVAHILRLANSAYYKAVTGVSTVREAVIRLGFREIRRLCLLSCVTRAFVKSSRGFDASGFWQHSYTVGTMARRIVEQHKLGEGLFGDQAFTAGLLHDVGLLILDQFFGVLYAIVRREIQRTGQSTETTERHYLQVDHGEIGAALLEEWNIPAPVVMGVRFHHDIEHCDARYLRLSYVVALAERITVSAGLAGPGELPCQFVESQIMEELDLSPEDLIYWEDEARLEVDSSPLLLAG